MTTRTVTMSHSELDRFAVITRVRERRLTQVEAARILDLGVRQVQRLCAAVAQQGADRAAEAKYRCRENQAACNTARRIVWGSVAATKDSFGYK
jgi:hypothetical protein